MTGGLDLRPTLPALIVAVTAVCVLLAQAFTPRDRSGPFAALSLIGLLGALATVVVLALGRGRGAITGGTYALDDFALFFHGLLLVVGIVAVLLSPSYLRATGSERGEYYSLVLFSLVGML